MGYEPTCTYCRDNEPLYHKGCQGCQERMHKALNEGPKNPGVPPLPKPGDGEQ